MIEAQITLDTFRENNIPILKIPQESSPGRELIVTITAMGKKISFPSSGKVTIIASRPDGLTKSFSGSVNAFSDTAVIPIDSWMLSVVGEVECWVSVASGTEKYTTNSFLIEVQHVPGNTL